MEEKTSIGSVIATIIIIAIIILGGLYFWGKRIEQQQAVQSFTPATTTETVVDNSNDVATTTDWKTYSSVNLGFQVQYPSDYLLTENKTGISIASSQSCVDIFKTGGGQWPKDCFIYDLLIQKNKIEGGTSQVSSIKVAGYSSEGLGLVGGMYDNLNQTYIQFQKSGNWYISYLSYNSGDKIVAENLLNQILSTFKFTK